MSCTNERKSPCTENDGRKMCSRRDTRLFLTDTRFLGFRRHAMYRGGGFMIVGGVISVTLSLQSSWVLTQLHSMTVDR